jgi:NAD(P) transhydrogenase subunit beta
VSPVLRDVLYLLASASFIVGLKKLSGPRTAVGGNRLAAAGMTVAAVATFAFVAGARGVPTGNLVAIIVALLAGGVLGGVLAVRIQMTAMPQLVALFNGFGGIASALVALGEVLHATPEHGSTATVTGLGVLVGGLTLTGSVVAFGKLQGIMNSAPVTFPLQKTTNAAVLLVGILLVVLFARDPSAPWLLVIALVVSFALGVMAVIPIGGADMPVVIALLNSYSGIAASMAGYAIGNDVLVIAGALVGASGIILTVLMCRAMNRSLANVLFGAFGTGDSPGTAAAPGAETRTVRHYTVEDGAILLANAQSLVVVPGYGLAVAQAQHAVRELCDLCAERGAEVKYGIHPVAGRMPGHMNVLLAEADVPYEQLLDMDQVNPLFETTDVVLVVGANDVINPCARTDKTSPIYGMPILDVDKARNVIILKRSLAAGFAGIQNELFFDEKTMMLFGDAKKTILALTGAVSRL